MRDTFGMLRNERMGGWEALLCGGGASFQRRRRRAGGFCFLLAWPRARGGAEQ